MTDVIDNVVRFEMRICFISHCAYPLFSKGAGEMAGGAEAQLVTLGKAFKDKGYDVHFVVGDYGQPNIQKIENITLHKSSLRYMGGSNLYLLPDWLKLWRVLLRINADIHLMKVPRHLLLPVSLYARIRGKKVAYIGQRDVDATKEGALSADGRMAYWFYRSGLFFSNSVVAQTEMQKTLFYKSFSKQAVVIKNVITLTPEGSKPKREYILWVGNSSQRKQPEMFVELARLMPEYEFRMIMSISNERADDVFIRKEAEKLDNLEYMGTVQFKDMAAHYNGARLFVSTSLSEGFPNTFLQSWQHGVPVVSLLIDPDKVVSKFDLGRVSGSSEAMLDDIRALMTNDGLAEKLGRNGKEYVEKNHSLANVISGYEKFFDSL